MTIPSEKPGKKCRYCGKEVKNLGFHVANNHPNILDQLEEISPSPPPATPTPSPNSIKNPGVSGDINALIREKLDTMLNIKIIEMLSSNPNASLQEISQAINPPQKTTLQELKEYHDLVYGSVTHTTAEEGGASFADVAMAAIPLIQEMLPKKQEEKKNDKLGTSEERSLRILKPISAEVAGDPGESGGTRSESGDPSETKQ